MIDRDELLELLTTEDIINIMKDLGTDYITVPSDDNQLYFRTVCHQGNKYKLLFYKDSKLFHCLTECGIISIYDVIMGAKHCEFREAFTYILDFKGIKNTHKRKKGINIREDNNDLDFLNRHLYKPNQVNINLPYYDENILNFFDDYFPSSWIEEDISEEEMDFFGIKMWLSQLRAIIPHRNLEGKLIGIRCRNFLQQYIDEGKKYMPITIQNLTYKYPTGLSLYGIYENKDNIKRIKKVIIFEGEKSVLKYGSYYGRNNNIALATLGTTIHLYQRKQILDLGVNEVIFAYDKQYIFDLINKGDKKSIKEYNAYIKKMIKAFKLFSGYCVFSIIYCDNDETLDYKDSPIDKGKEVFEFLNKNRITIYNVEELEECLIEV